VGAPRPRPDPLAGNELTTLLACPECAGRLAAADGHLRCASGHDYPVVDGIPILSNADTQDEHKRRQAEWFDGEDSEFEISRPHGAPRLYRWLMEEKFRRSVAGLEDQLLDTTVLTVCGGSGMDAEFLARAGARVIASDISFGAAARAAERARRLGLPITPVVADVERLPFPDRSIDVVYVHDGLHHLADPAAGLAEMARVARRAVAVTEPARAAATALAVRLGIALEQEESGNPVARMAPAELSRALAAQGFTIAGADRYAMYYRHVPGRASRILSLPLAYTCARAMLLAFNALLGGIGNKLSVRAVRSQP
jgi:SAM-dependent methyltransferase